MITKFDEVGLFLDGHRPPPKGCGVPALPILGGSPVCPHPVVCDGFMPDMNL